jgi:hypothetical protein
MAETCQLLMAQRRVSHTAAALADLVAQDTEIGNEEVRQLYEAGCTILRPFPVHRLRIRLTSVVLDSTKTKKEAIWSENNNRGLDSHGSKADLTTVVQTPLEAAGDGVILAEVEYDHFSPIGHFLPGATKLTHRAEMRPRRSQDVKRVTGTTPTSTTPKICFG